MTAHAGRSSSATFAAGTTYDDLPDEVVDSVEMRVLDTLGIAVAAAPSETSRAARRWAPSRAAAAGDRRRRPEPAPGRLAAFVNGVLAHSLDYDDTHLPSVLHPSASVVPAALAAAEQARRRRARAGRAPIAVGLEVCVRLGMAGYDQEPPATRPSSSTASTRPRSAARWAARSRRRCCIAGDDARRHRTRSGVAASMASGIIEANRTGGTVKRMHCGWAAHSAVSAVGAGRATDSPVRPRCSRAGSASSRPGCTAASTPSAVIDGLGETWAVPDIFFKPYPANHFTHAAVDAARRAARARASGPTTSSD